MIGYCVPLLYLSMPMGWFCFIQNRKKKRYDSFILNQLIIIKSVDGLFMPSLDLGGGDYAQSSQINKEGVITLLVNWVSSLCCWLYY